MELNKTSYVILGMLRLGRHTGYDIKQLVDVSTRFFWAASYGQIYPELARLEEAGLVRGESDEASGRRRRTWRGRSSWSGGRGRAASSTSGSAATERRRTSPSRSGCCRSGWSPGWSEPVSSECV